MNATGLSLETRHTKYDNDARKDLCRRKDMQELGEALMNILAKGGEYRVRYGMEELPEMNDLLLGTVVIKHIVEVRKVVI